MTTDLIETPGYTPARTCTTTFDNRSAHFHSPALYTFRKMAKCWNCSTVRRCVVDLQAWYGASVTCCHCGDGWVDGEAKMRPFKRGWRAESIARAVKKWNSSAAYDSKVSMAMTRQALGPDDVER